MSEQDKKRAVKDEEKKKAEGKEELTEDQLETVAGGVLIGLNQPAFKDLAQKDFGVGGLTETVKLDQSFKFIK